MKRRTLLQAGATGLALGLVPFSLTASEVKLELTTSPLVYLSPIKPDGSLSSCQAEVWYVMLGADLLVVTASESWRARAPSVGVATTRVWVGDKGVWRSGEYLSLPETNATASIETDPGAIELALRQFGSKYSDEWGRWGPRFRRGLADGSRTMLRYQLV